MLAPNQSSVVLAPRGARTCTKKAQASAQVSIQLRNHYRSLYVRCSHYWSTHALHPAAACAAGPTWTWVRPTVPCHRTGCAVRTSARQRQEGSLHAAPETTTPRTIARLLRDRRSASPTSTSCSYPSTQRLCPGDETWSRGLPRVVLRAQTPRLQGERRAAEGDSAALGSTGRPVHATRRSLRLMPRPVWLPRSCTRAACAVVCPITRASAAPNAPDGDA
jgi:hypothetical protein